MFDVFLHLAAQVLVHPEVLNLKRVAPRIHLTWVLVDLLIRLEVVHWIIV